MSKLSSLAISSFAVSLTSAFLLACGGAGTPPARPTEVAMDPTTGGSAPSSAPSDDSAPATTPAASSDGDPSSAMMGGGDPSAASPTPATTPDPTPDPAAGKGGKGKGKKGKGDAAGGAGALSKAECQQLSDKGIDLLIAGMGLDPASAAQVKAQAAGDPNMTSMMSECGKTTTRAQYKCGMAATSKEAWQTCLK